MFTFQIDVMEMLLMIPFVRLASFSSILLVLLAGEVRIEDVVKIVEKSVHVEVERLATERRVTLAAIVFSALLLVCR